MVHVLLKGLDPPIPMHAPSAHAARLQVGRNCLLSIALLCVTPGAKKAYKKPVFRVAWGLAGPGTNCCRTWLVSTGSRRCLNFGAISVSISVVSVSGLGGESYD